MKRIVYSARTDASKLASGEKSVRQMIWTVWATTPDGEDRFFSDPEMTCNLVKEDFLNYRDSVDPKASYSKYVFDHRNDIFEERVMNYIERSKYSGFVKDHMIEYFYSLDPSDYNRMLYLKRDEKDMR